jgi:flagellar hook-associated protein 3
MSLRVTQGLMTTQMKRRLASGMAGLYDLQDRISSEKRVIKPSDDSTDFARALNLKDAIGVAQRYKKNSQETSDWLTVTETQVDGVVTSIQSLQTSVVQSANDTLTSSERADLSEQVNEMLESMVSAANAGNAGRYVFAGFETLREPFVVERGQDGQITNVTYRGDDGEMRREIANNDIISANVTGRELFLGSAHTVRARDGSQVFADPALPLSDVAQGFVPPFTDTIVSLNGKAIRISGSQTINDIARTISDDPEAGVTATVEETPDGVVPAGYRMVFTNDDANEPLTFDYVSGPDTVPYAALGGSIYVNDVRVDLLAGDDLSAIATKINTALTAAGVTDVTADVLAHTSGNFLRIVGPEGEQVEVRDGTEALFATITPESFLAKQSIVDGNNAIVGDQQGMDNIFQTLIQLRDDLAAGGEPYILPDVSVTGTGMVQRAVNSTGYLSGQVTVRTDAAGDIAVDYTHSPPIDGVTFDRMYQSLAMTDAQTDQLRTLNRAIVVGTTSITDSDLRLDSATHVNASPPPGWATSPTPKTFTVNGETFTYTGAESLRDIATLISSYDFAGVGKVDLEAQVDAEGHLRVSSVDGSPLDIQDAAAPPGTGLMEALGMTEAGGLVTKAVKLDRDSLSAFGITLTLGAAAAGTQVVSFGPLAENTREDNLTEIGLTMRVQGGGITGAYGAPTNSQSGTYRLTSVGPLTYGALTTQTTGAVTATVAAAHTMQAGATFTMELDAAGNTVANTVRYLPATNGGTSPNAEQLAQLAALNAGGVAPDLSTFGLTVTPGAGAGTLSITVQPATIQVQSEFTPIDGSQSVVTMDTLTAYSLNELTTSIPGAKLITGELHIGGQAIVTSTSRVRELARDLSLGLSVQSSVGSRQSRAEATVTTLTKDITSFTDLLSKTEDLDVASALVDLQELENTYQAALSVGAKVIQPTLMDFLS